MKKVKHFIEYTFALIIVGIASLISWEGLRSISLIIARLLRVLIPGRDEVARENIRRALHCDQKAARRKSLKSFQNIVLTILELIKMSGGLRASRYIYFTSEEPFERVYSAGRGCLLISAHLGNWELMAKRVVEMGYPVNVLVKAQSNPYVENLFRRVRERCGVKVLYTKESAREMIRLLKRGEFVAILVDQDAGDSGVLLPFFGMEASWEEGPALLANNLGTPIITGFDVRYKSGEHIAFIQHPFYLESEGDGAVEEFYDIYIERLEKFIRLAPGQYHWLHRRWK